MNSARITTCPITPLEFVEGGSLARKIRGKPLPPLGGAVTKPAHFLCYEIWRKPGFTACFADSSVRFVRGDTDEAILRALITRDGGEKVDRARLD